MTCCNGACCIPGKEKCCGDYCCPVGKQCCGGDSACCEPGDTCCGVDNCCSRGDTCVLTRYPGGFNYGTCRPSGCTSKPLAASAARKKLSGAWTGTAVAGINGVELQGLRLKGREVASSVRVPYVLVSTNRGVANKRVWLTAAPSKEKNVPHSRLVAMTRTLTAGGQQVDAEFHIDGLGSRSTACLRVTVRFLLTFAPAGTPLQTGFGGNSVRGCNPVQGWAAADGGFDCGAVRAWVEYKLLAAQGSGPAETITAFSAAQRLLFTPDGKTIKRAGYFADCDAVPFAPSCLKGVGNPAVEPLAQVFSRVESPAKASSGTAFDLGRKAIFFDNIHLTSDPRPFTAPQFPLVKGSGCPECVHLHWRWGTVTRHAGTPFGKDTRKFTTGKPLAGDAQRMVWAFADPVTKDPFARPSATASRSTLWFLASGKKASGALLVHSFFVNPKGRGAG